MKHLILRYTLLLCSLAPAAAFGQKLKAVQQIEGIPPRIEYRAITHDPSGNIYVATSADVFMIPARSNQAQAMNAGTQIVDVDWSADYGLIMLTREGRVRFISTGKELALDAGAGATCMDLTKSMIWVGTENGVYTISIPKEEVSKHYTTNDGVLLSNQITFIHTDPFGILWILTRSGVLRIE